MLDAFLSQYQWYRKLCGGHWILLRLDIYERPTFWTRYDSEKKLEDLYVSRHTILEQEFYN